MSQLVQSAMQHELQDVDVKTCEVLPEISSGSPLDSFCHWICDLSEMSETDVGWLQQNVQHVC